MWIFAFLVIAVLCVSLYDFFDTRSWHKVTYDIDGQQSEKLRMRHRRANIIRRTYNRVMLFTVGGMVVFIALSLYTQTIVGNMYPYEPTEIPKYDTTVMSLEAPPLEDVQTVENNYKVEGNSSRDVAAQERVEEQKGEETPRKNTNSEQTPQDNQPQRTKGLATDDIRAMEAEFQTTRAEMLKRREENERRRAQEKLDYEKKRTESNNSAKNSRPVTSKSGTADVEWNKSQRKAFQNNDDNVRTPKYTCPSGVSGKVQVRVKINSMGNVTSAVPLTSGVDDCLMEQAVLYARTKSRFEVSSRELEELTLTYTFYP